MTWFKKLTFPLLATSIVFTSSCGTLLYPERSGQRGGPVDPAVVILNGVGVLFYVIPGLVAFAIDFSNGTIYLPGGRRAATAVDDEKKIGFDGPLNKEAVSAIIEKEFDVRDVFNDHRLIVSTLR